MGLEGDDRPGRVSIRALRQHWLAPLPTAAPITIIQADAGCEIRPAVPLTRMDLVEIIWVTDYIPPPALIHPVLSREQASIRVKSRTIWVAKTPCHDFKVRAVWFAA